MIDIKKVRIGKRIVGEGYPTLIIAEAANNHDGNFKTAKKMASAAGKMGADAVKFQCMVPEDFAVKSHSYFKLYDKLRFSEKEWLILKKVAKKNKLLFVIDVLDEGSVDMMDKVGVDAFKIHCGDINNKSMLEKVAKKKKPILLHTGTASFDEIKWAVRIMSKFNKNIIPMFGFQDYPTKMKQLNLNVLKTLKKEISNIVGFADHTAGIAAPLIAIGAGADVIEKHFSLNRRFKNYDWESAIEPPRFKKMVKLIREADKAMGDEKFILTDKEKKWIPVIRKFIVARKDIKKGEIIKKSMIAFKRSGKKGLSPLMAGKVVGKKAKKDIKQDELLSLSMVKK